MNEQPLVSIILPSFNVEPYIKKCLDSIKAQTYSNWECIIVDRPSTKDKTTLLIKQYIKDDERFHFIEQINKGVSDGRNVGLEAAKGKYVQFTDPDDWVSPELLERSVKRAEDTDAEIVQFAWSNYYVQTNQFVDTGFIPFIQKFPKIFSVNTLGNEIFKYGELYINSMSKLWRRDFLQRVEFHYPVGLKRAEDLAEVSRAVMMASRMTYLDDVLYFYKIDEFIGDSLSNFTSDDGHSLDFYKAIIIVHENMKTLKLLPKFKDGFCRVAVDASSHALYMSKFSISANREIYECIRSQIFPIISKELKTLRPDLYELFKNHNHDQYLEKQMKEIYFDSKLKQDHIHHLELENVRINNELEDHLSIKRSAKLTLGNIKRRIIRK